MPPRSCVCVRSSESRPPHSAPDCRAPSARRRSARRAARDARQPSGIGEDQHDGADQELVAPGDVGLARRREARAAAPPGTCCAVGSRYCAMMPRLASSGSVASRAIKVAKCTPLREVFSSRIGSRNAAITCSIVAPSARAPQVHAAEAREPLLGQRLVAAREHRAIERLLRPEVIRDQRERHLRGRREIAHRHAVEAVRGEQPLGHGEDALAGLVAVAGISFFIRRSIKNDVNEKPRCAAARLRRAGTLVPALVRCRRGETACTSVPALRVSSPSPTGCAARRARRSPARPRRSA